MNYRKLGKTGFEISEISLGTWQVGGRWGEPFSKKTAEGIINRAIDSGINFIDTADVYGNGLSEKMVGEVVRQRSERIYVASKIGRRFNPHNNEAYIPKALRLFVEQSLRNTGLETLDLIQLHCPPSEVYDRPEIFGLFEQLKEEGKILNMGVSVEKVEEAQKALLYDNVCTVQIIFNMFRHKPADTFFAEAAGKDVGIIVRVPLASGLLTGLYSKKTEFGKEDHRNFNRDGAMFDKGETFSGVDYESGLQAVEELRVLFSGKENLASLALRWILMFEQVSCVIPGASKDTQLVSNLAALDEKPFSPEQMEGVEDIYNRLIKPQVNQLW
ncbi:MAG: aldo/keto reductase [Bacteroides sp.]|nr:aldo/keto reductase [Bacteroides sp.]